MKKSIKLILIQVIFLILAGRAFSEPYDDLFLYASKLDQAGAYEEAELEYKRYIFMLNYSQVQYEAQAFCALADLYEKKENYTLAAEYIQKAIISLNGQETDDLRSKHIFYLQKAASEEEKQYLSDNLYIFAYMNIPEFSDQIKKQAYSAAITDALAKGRIEYAQKTFEQALELFPQAWNQKQIETINTGFEKLTSFKPKKQKLAGYLSFFPGLGQLYAGNYKDSLNAFLLNGAIITVSAWSIYTLDLWTFSLLEFNPLMRFMQGNIYNAQKDAYLYNLNKQQEFSAPIIEELKQ